MLEAAWSLVAMLVAVGAAELAAVLLVAAGSMVQGRRWRRDQGDEAWASVTLMYMEQADGPLPVGVVRVQNPAAAPVIVSASIRTPTRWRPRASLSVRSPKASRRPRVPEGTLLGAVSGGAVKVWELPVGEVRRPAVRVRLDRAGAGAKVFTWVLDGPPAPATRPTPRAGLALGRSDRVRTGWPRRGALG